MTATYHSGGFDPLAPQGNKAFELYSATGTATGWDTAGNVVETWDLSAEVEVEVTPAVWSTEVWSDPVWSDPVYDEVTGELLEPPTIIEPAVLLEPAVELTPAVTETRIGAALYWADGQLVSGRPLTDTEKAMLTPVPEAPPAVDPVTVLAAVKAAILANPGVATVDELAQAIVDAIPEVP